MNFVRLESQECICIYNFLLNCVSHGSGEIVALLPLLTLWVMLYIYLLSFIVFQFLTVVAKLIAVHIYKSVHR